MKKNNISTFKKIVSFFDHISIPLIYINYFFVFLYATSYLLMIEPVFQNLKSQLLILHFSSLGICLICLSVFGFVHFGEKRIKKFYAKNTKTNSYNANIFFI